MKVPYIVDPQFQTIVDSYTWCQRALTPFYPTRMLTTSGIDKKKRAQYLHQLILQLLGIVIPEGFTPDHINQNALDNRACNLRLVTENINIYNRPSKNYYRNGLTKKYIVCIRSAGEVVYYRYCSTEQEAIRAAEKGRRLVYKKALIISNSKLRESLSKMGEDPERPFLLLNQTEVFENNSLCEIGKIIGKGK